MMSASYFQLDIAHWFFFLRVVEWLESVNANSKFTDEGRMYIKGEGQFFGSHFFLRQILVLNFQSLLNALAG